MSTPAYFTYFQQPGFLGLKVLLNTTRMKELKREVKTLLLHLKVQLIVVAIANGLRYGNIAS